MATIRRFFVENVGKEAVLCGDEYSHAKNVLRLQEGDEVVLLDGSGTEYDAIISKVSKGEMLCTVTGRRPSDKECRTRVRLLIGALKGDKTELVVQKATELGVMRIGVFSSRYCAAYMNENKLERLRRVAREAAKQCLRATVPEVVYYETLEEALRAGEDCRHKLFACEFLPAGGEGLGVLQESVCAVVGSEGGFSEEEYETARQLGYTGISLGRRILRAETAAIALTSVIMYAAGELR